MQGHAVIVRRAPLHGDSIVNGGGEDDAFIVIGMIAEQFDAAWGSSGQIIHGGSK